jgi:7-keto-8-aminopelargonate synthetase-like enzyme
VSCLPPAVGVAVRQALPMAAELSRAAARLRAVAPKLRAKGAARAVDLFLSRDALAPVAFDFMSDRAARRLCDRLVALGASVVAVLEARRI